eukprot:c20414_g1_i3.p1 GENE.c20414_g1_i3~~c20414_g1_i3.p1  ORF type:complete len:358 (+),score=87.02 c20414_g1_i3:144-1076(+)
MVTLQRELQSVQRLVTTQSMELQSLKTQLASAIVHTDPLQFSHTLRTAHPGFPEGKPFWVGQFKLLPTQLIVETRIFDNAHIYEVKLSDEARPYLRYFEDLGVLNTGRFSPVSLLNMNDRAKLNLGIPILATHFAVAFPMDGVMYLEDHYKTQLCWADVGFLFMLVGGMIFFDDNLSPLSCSAFLHGGDDITFVKAKPWRAPYTQALHNDSRFNHVTIATLKNYGVQRYSWITPREVLRAWVEGDERYHSWSAWPYGAFAYIFHSDPLDEHPNDCYFAVDENCRFATAMRNQAVIDVDHDGVEDKEVVDE